MPIALSATVRIAKRRDSAGFLALRCINGELISALATEANTTPSPASVAGISAWPTMFAAAAKVLALLTRPPITLIARNPIFPS